VNPVIKGKVLWTVSAQIAPAAINKRCGTRHPPLTLPPRSYRSALGNPDYGIVGGPTLDEKTDTPNPQHPSVEEEAYDAHEAGNQWRQQVRWGKKDGGGGSEGGGMQWVDARGRVARPRNA
jgi:hypothetical protein